jgi:hypothetical protein
MTWVARSLAVAAAVVALHGAAWFYASGRLEAEATAVLDDLRRQGWEIVADAPQRAGWPLAAGIRYRRVRMDGTSAGVPAAWRADDVDVRIRAVQPGTLLLAPSRMQQVRLGGGDWVEVAASLQLAVQADSAEAVGRDLVLQLPGGPVGIAGMHANLRGRTLQLDLAGIEAGPLLSAGHFMGAAVLTGPLLPGPDPAAAAAAWRDGGGAVQVNTLQLEAGDLQASASGAAALDSALQPVLNLTARVQGYRAALDRLVQAGVIQASAAVAAKAVLGLLSGRDPGAPATLPIRVAGGVVSVAGFPLLRLPAVDWTAEPRL